MAKRRFSDVDRVLDKWVDGIERQATAVIKRAARAVDERLVDLTPVDTGRARSNWVATRGVPFQGEIPAYSPGYKLGRAEAANARQAKAQAESVIRGFEAKPGRAIFLTNNVSYLALLNAGTSAQSPAGFFEMGAQTGAKVFENSGVFKRRR